MTYKDIMNDVLNNKYFLHHTSYCRKYISRKLRGQEYPIEKYNGRFGRGYKVYTPNYGSTQYSYVEYWIEKAS